MKRSGRKPRAPHFIYQVLSLFYSFMCFSYLFISIVWNGMEWSGMGKVGRYGEFVLVCRSEITLELDSAKQPVTCLFTSSVYLPYVL